MDRPPAHDYAAASAMAYAQQQQHQQQPPFGFHPQHQGQQFPPPPAFMPPPHPSMQQQFPYPHHLQQQQQHPHAPPHPHLLHHNQPLPGFSGHLPPPILPSPYHGGGGGGAYDSAPPPPAPPPSDPELQKRIDKLVEYSAKNGPEFEAMIRDKQQDNPAYSFLFGGEGHNYYRYKLWVSTRAPPAGPYNAGFAPSSSVPLMHPPPQMMQQPGFAPFYDPHQHHHQSPQPPFGAHGRGGEFDQSFKGLSGPLPPDVAVELTNVMNSLNGTKDSIKGAKIWFMQRSPFAPALAEGMRDRVFSVDDSERQLHVVYLANDILFDSLQRRANPHELDNEALAFKPVLGSMLARIYQNPVNKEENQSRLQKILQFWGAKEVYDHDTIRALEGEMVSGAPTSSALGAPKDLSDSMAAAAAGGFAHQLTNHHSASHWQLDNQLEHEHAAEKQVPFAAMPPPLAAQQFLANSAPASGFAGPVPIIPAAQPPLLQTPAPILVEKLPPYPLFPPGLIPGMVRKMQIGSGVPYSPLSPLDIPTMIPPSTVSPSEVLERVSKYFKEIGEVNPSEGPMKSSESDDDYDNDYERDRSPVRKGGACIPPPPNLQVVDPETGTYPDGSVERKPGALGSGRLGLGATADPNEVSQYDDVYSSYRKQRSSNYHTSMSARAAVSVKRSTTTT